MKENNRRILIIIIACMIVLGTVASTFFASARATRSAKAYAESVLFDSAREQTVTFASILEGRLHALSGISASLAQGLGADDAEIERQLEEISEMPGPGFANICLLRSDGSEVTAARDVAFSVADRVYFRQAMAGGYGMEHIVSRLSGRPCIAFAVPFYRDGQVAGVLRGIDYTSTLSSMIVSNAYGGEGYSFIIDGTGGIVINAEHKEDGMSDKGSITAALKDAVFSGGTSMNDFRKALAEDGSISLHYTLDGYARVAVLIPVDSPRLPENDWFMLNIVHEDLLAAEINARLRDATDTMLIFAVFAAAALVLLVVLEGVIRRRDRLQSELIRQREEQFRIVTEQSGKFVMRYDIESKTSQRSDPDRDGFGGDAVCGNCPESVIASGIIDPAGIDDCRAFFNEINDGESPVSAGIPMVLSDGRRRWYKYDSTTIFDLKGVARTAIISYYDYTEQREQELAYARWQQELESIPYEHSAVYEWNLTKDFSEGQHGLETCDYSDLKNDSFNARTEVFAARHVAAEDRADYVSMLSREHLLAEYFRGEYRPSMDYRRLSDDGDTRWWRISAQMVPYPDGRNIKVYVINRDIDADKRRELTLLARSEQDFLTGALNRETFIERVRQIIDRAPDSRHALLMLDVDGFKQVNDILGHDAGDGVLRDLTGYIRIALRSGDLVGRIGGDEFMVYLPDMPSDEAIAKKAGLLCGALRRRLSGSLVVSVSIGIAVYPRDGKDFDALYKCADAALYGAKKSGRDNFSFYRAGMSQGAPVTQIDRAVPPAAPGLSPQRTGTTSGPLPEDLKKRTT